MPKKEQLKELNRDRSKVIKDLMEELISRVEGNNAKKEQK